MRFPAPQQAAAAFLLLASCSCGELDLGGDNGQDAWSFDGHEVGDFSWNPPIEGLGEPGWRDSTEPWCSQAGTEYELVAFDLWSDASGVYVLGEYMYAVPGGAACPSDHPACWTRTAIFANDGSGWRIFWEETREATGSGPRLLSGIPGGPLITVGGMFCGLSFISGGAASCQIEQYVYDVHAASGTLAYALISAEGDPNQKLVSFDGSSWSPVPTSYTPYQVEALWCDEEALYCAGPDGTVISLEDGEWRVHDTQTLGDFRSVWGFGEEDVWAAGGDTGLMHYDGERWSPVEWPCASDGYCGVNGMWGMDGVLFLHSDSHIVKWDGSSFEVLARWESPPIVVAIWGNSPEEVFFAVRDRDRPHPECGIYYLLWWDGASFHWL